MLLFFHKESVGKIINIESEIKSETPLTVHAKLQPKAVDLLSFPLFNLKIIFPSSAQINGRGKAPEIMILSNTLPVKLVTPLHNYSIGHSIK